MLRNKLSKLIVSMMAAVMITGAGVSGQAVKATTVQTQTNGTQTKVSTLDVKVDSLTQITVNGVIEGIAGTDVTIEIIDKKIGNIVPGGEVKKVPLNNGNLSYTVNNLTLQQGETYVVQVKDGSTVVVEKEISIAKNVVATLDSIKVNNLLEVEIKGKVTGITGTTVDVEIQELPLTQNVSKTEKVTVDVTTNSFSHLFKSLTLKPDTSYVVIVKDGTTELTRQEIRTNKTTVTNITTTSANINIPVGIVPATGTTKIYVKDSKGSNLVGYPKDLNKGASTEVVTGLTSSTSYTYELIHTAQAAAGQTGQTIKLSEGTFTTLNSSLVTGGGNNGSSTIVTPQITSNDISRSTIKDVTATLEVSNNTAYNSLRDAREITTNIKGVTAEFVNGKLELKGLVPEKEYSNLDITYINRDGRKGTIKVAKFTTKKSETKIRQFVTDVYRYALDRLADEEGFAYWVTGLEKKTITSDTLVKNLLNEKEFIEKHKTTEDKINGLYQVIVNRKSDAEGLKFWTNKYDGLIKTGYSDAMALRILVDQMVNEQEFKNRVKDLGL